MPAEINIMTGKNKESSQHTQHLVEAATERFEDISPETLNDLSVAEKLALSGLRIFRIPLKAVVDVSKAVKKASSSNS